MKKSLLTIIGCAFSFSLAIGQTQPPNPGFEDWDDLGNYEEPTEWSSANECSDQLGVYSSAKTSTDPHSGTYAARMVTQNALFGAIKVNGLIATSTMICDPLNPGNKDGKPYFERPDSIVGWYKYAPVDTDNGYVQVMLLDTVAGGSVDTIAYIKHDFNDAKAEWTRFSAPINYNSTGYPNLCAILFNSSWGNGNNNEAFVGSELIIDDIELVFNPTTGLTEGYDATEWRVYPNPASDEVNISIGREGLANIEVLDITGKVVFNKVVNGANRSVSVLGLTEGIYLYQLTTTDGQAIRTGKLLVSH